MIDGLVTYTNERFLRVCGHSHDEMDRTAGKVEQIGSSRYDFQSNYPGMTFIFTSLGTTFIELSFFITRVRYIDDFIINSRHLVFCSAFVLLL